MLITSQIFAIWLILSYSVDFAVYGNLIKNPNEGHVRDATLEKEEEKPTNPDIRTKHVKDVKNATLEDNEEKPSNPDRRSALNKLMGGIIGECIGISLRKWVPNFLAQKQIFLDIYKTLSQECIFLYDTKIKCRQK